MDILIVGVIAVLGVLGMLGVFGRGIFGTLARIVLLIVTLAFAALTVFCLYAMVAGDGRGAGVLIFLAIPAGVITLIAFNMLMGSIDASRYHDLSPIGQHQFANESMDAARSTFADLVAEKESQLGKWWLMPARRRRLERERDEANNMLRTMDLMEKRYRDAVPAPDSDSRPPT
jgi:hypothetical protein